MEISQIVKIAEDASAEIMQRYNSGDFEVKIKSDESPVTDADLAAHKLITQRLKLVSNDPILSEEDPPSYETRKTWQRFWLVDPLDGTKDFIKRTGDFTVNIALIDGHEAVLGVVAIPAQGIVYFAEKGKGAFRKDSHQTVQIKTSEESRELRCAVSRFHCSESTTEFCERNGITQLVGYGSALKITKIADGEVDVYPRLSPTMEWDIAAGHCILSEAGGRLYSSESGLELSYNKESLLNESFIAARADLKFK